MDDRKPKVSVLALAYNQADYLEETLDSIRNQSFQDFELLISDDASRDESAARIQAWNANHGRAQHLLLHKQNAGLCPTLNELLSLASGDYIQIIACDDLLTPTALQERVDILDNAPDNVAAVYSDAVMMNDKSEDLSTTFLRRFLKNRPIPRGDLYAQLLLGNFMPALTVLIRRSAIEAVGNYDTGLIFEDWDLWQRLSREFDFEFTPGPAGRYRVHENNMHRTMKQQARQFYRILAKHKDHLRARLRILLTIQRNPDDFRIDAPELQDFLSWARDYPETRFFVDWYLNAGSVTRATTFQLVTVAEKLSRPFTDFSFRQRRAG